MPSDDGWAPETPGRAGEPSSGRAPLAPGIPDEVVGAGGIVLGVIPPPAGKDEGAGWAAQGEGPAQRSRPPRMTMAGHLENTWIGRVDDDPPVPRLRAIMGLPP